MFLNSQKTNIEEIIEKLQSILDPITGNPITEIGLIEGVNIEKKQIYITLKVAPHQIQIYESVRHFITETLLKCKGIDKVFTVMTAHQGQDQMPKKNVEPPQSKSKFFVEKLDLSQIKSVIAIVSGKGGVGKSSVALNLALALKDQGQQVGILDADIYGPSLPKMLHLYEKPLTDAHKKIQPLQKFDLFCMSIGFFVPEDAPVIWRGPIIQTSLVQLLKDVAWPDLDFLIIDLPPGTGDIQLTLIQKVSLAGAIIVSTPQDLALIDARKALHMFQKLDIPILGMIENMSSFCCPECGHISPIFHQDTVQSESLKYHIPFLGKIPLSMELRQAADEGIPLSIKNPRHSLVHLFSKIAEELLKKFI